MNKPTLLIEVLGHMSRDAYSKLLAQTRNEFPEQRLLILEGGMKVKQMWTGDPEIIAKAFHDTYEKLAPEYGYSTREESAVHWDDVPESNKKLMIATAASLLEEGVIS